MGKHYLSAEEQAARDTRKVAMRAVAKQVAAMTPDQRMDLARRVPVATIEGRTLSVFNQCLVASQAPGATIVGGFRQWLKAGRCVRKGEHGLGIWIPSVKSDANKQAGETSSAEEVRFIFGTVFDISQTAELQAGEIIASASPEVAAWLDQNAALQNAGLLHVAEVSNV